MADKIFKVNPGDEIIITVPRRQPRGGSEILGMRSPKGMIRPRRIDDFLPRRRLDNLINFYDFGLIKSGDAFADADLSWLPTLTEFQAGGFPSETGVNLLRSKLNAPLARDASEWKSLYRRVDYASAIKYRFGVGFEDAPVLINETNENWKSGGLKRTTNFNRLKIEGLTVNDKQVYYDDTEAFTPFDTADADTIKVTAAPDYNAAAVSVELSGNTKTDVFLNPSPVVFAAQKVLSENEITNTYQSWSGGKFRCNQYSCSYDGPGLDEFTARLRVFTQDFEANRDILNYFVTHWQRSLIFNDALRVERDLEANELLADMARAMRLHTQARRVLQTETHHQIVNHIELVPGQRGTVDLTVPNGCPMLGEPVTEGRVIYCGAPPPAGAESNDFTESNAAASGYDETTSTLTYAYRPVIARSLVAVIKQRDLIYYVWRKPADGGGES